MVRDYERLKKVRAPKRPKRSKRKPSKFVADRQYNVVQIAKGAATAAGIASNPTGEGSSTADVQNRAGKVEVTEKRKAEALEGGMEVEQSEAAEEVVVEDSEAARAAKQQRI